MQKYTEIKSNELERRFKLEGISIKDIIIDGSSVKSATLEDKKGNIIKINYCDYRVSFFAPEEPKFEKKYVLKGKYRGLEVYEIYEYQSDAQTRHGELDNDTQLYIEHELVEVKEK